MCLHRPLHLHQAQKAGVSHHTDQQKQIELKGALLTKKSCKAFTDKM